MILGISLLFSDSNSGKVLGSMFGVLAILLTNIISVSVRGIFSNFVFILIAGGVLMWKLNKDGGSD